MNIFVREMRANAKALFFWCLGVAATIGICMMKFSGLKDSPQTINDLISKMPKAIRFFAGGGQVDISKASGYFSMAFLYIMVLAALHAVLLGANILSKEERDKTAEFLLAKPVSRNNVVFQKLAAALANVLIFTVVSTVISILSINYYEKLTNEILVLMTGMLLVQLVFLSIGLVMASAYKDPKKASTVSSSILFVTFFLSLLIDMTENMDWLTFLSPFKYFSTSGILKGDSLSIPYAVLSIGISIVLSILSFVFYKKRDLKI
jgi:ABC-2 type transport system permease protein